MFNSNHTYKIDTNCKWLERWLLNPYFHGEYTWEKYILFQIKKTFFFFLNIVVVCMFDLVKKFFSFWNKWNVRCWSLIRIRLELISKNFLEIRIKINGFFYFFINLNWNGIWIFITFRTMNIENCIVFISQLFEEFELNKNTR